MPRTPDRSPGEASEEGTNYENLAPGNDPPTVGGVRMVNGEFRMRDSLGVFNPRTDLITEIGIITVAGSLVYRDIGELVVQSA